MPPTWKDDSKAHRVIEFLDGVLGLNEEGKVTLGFGGEFDAGVATLSGLTNLSDEIPDADRYSIVRRGLIETKKTGEFNPKRVLQEIKSGQGDFLRQPKKPYVLLTSLSLRYFDELATVRPYGATITFTRYPPKRFERPEIAKKAAQDDHYSIPRSFTTVRIHVRARNESDAVEAALNRLDLIRCFWNLALTYKRKRYSGGIGHRPVNPVVIGPIHTLHDPNGTPVSEAAWWQPNFSPDVRGKNLRSKYENMKEVEEWGRERLAESQFEETLQELLIRYVHAQDEADLQSAYLKLWAVLEDLTNVSGETVVKRTAMMFLEPGYRKVVLDELRSMRNRMVHEGHESQQAEILVYELKRYVDTLLQYLLRHVEEWDQLSDFGLFLSLPQDPAEVKKRRRYHDLAYNLLAGE